MNKGVKNQTTQISMDSKEKQMKTLPLVPPKIKSVIVSHTKSSNVHKTASITPGKIRRKMALCIVRSEKKKQLLTE